MGRGRVLAAVMGLVGLGGCVHQQREVRQERAEQSQLPSPIRPAPATEGQEPRQVVSEGGYPGPAAPLPEDPLPPPVDATGGAGPVGEE